MTRTKKVQSVGRPPKYDLIEEARLLDEWSIKPNSTSLYQFTDEKTYLAQDLSVFASACDEFNLSLKKAKERIGQRRSNACDANTMNYGVWNRSVRVYDPLVKGQEDADDEKEQKNKKDLIDYSKSLESTNAPLQDSINLVQQNYALSYKIQQLEEEINALKSKTSQIVQ